MGEEHGAEFSDADVDREFADIVRHGMRGKPVWYLVPLRMLCSMVFFMTLSLCIVANGAVMDQARWETATLISFGVAVVSGVGRRGAKAWYDRRVRKR
ncbi:hypothetical protein ABZY90_34795 [Streptomyces sp. NPDC006422]|uniref:hypothetical protein n=1 Tax=unclassified Streptomyces TaxID=2593676 RepID=UPI0033BAC241